MLKHLSRLMLTLVCLACTSVAHAQIRSATLTGTVTDSQKAIVPGATVVVTNEGTNATQQLVTNEDGLFTAPLLPAGTYSVTVTLSGFAPFKRSGIILNAIGFPTDMFTALFALARTVGWVAQWNEMISDPEQKIGRPRQLYVGPTQRDYVPVGKR